MSSEVKEESYDCTRKGLASETHRHLSIIYFSIWKRKTDQSFRRRAFSGPESQTGTSEAGRAERGLRDQLKDLFHYSTLTWSFSVRQPKA